MGKSKRVIEARWADRKDEWARKLELVDNPEFRKEYRAVTGLALTGALMFGYSSVIAIVNMFQYQAMDLFRDGSFEQNLILAGFVGISAIAVMCGALYGYHKFDKKWGL